MQNQNYDPANSLIFFDNNKMREGKNDPTHTGTLTDANGQEYWLSIWPKTNRKDGSTFYTGSFRLKEARPQQGRPSPARAGSLSMRRRPVDTGDDLP